MVALTLTLAATTACSGSHENHTVGTERVLTSKEYVELYQQIVASFPQELPTGVTLPDEPPHMDGNIGDGNAGAVAYFFWNCAWEDVYLSSQDPEAQATAMDNMRTFQSTDWALAHYSDPDGIWDKALDAAELGDLTQLRGWYDSDCGYYREVEGK